MDDVAKRLRSDFHEELYRRTLHSMLDRVETDGFFQESLTGAYAGMFPRTVGGLVSLFLETGDLDRCERLVGCVLGATRDSDMERIPHVFDRRCTTREPVARGADVLQPDHPIALYRLDHGFVGAQWVSAPRRPLRAFEAFVTTGGCDGTLLLSIRAERDAEPLRVVRLPVRQTAGGWIRFPMEPRLGLPAGRRFLFSLTFEGQGQPIWWGLAEAGAHPLAGACAYDPPPANVWYDHPAHAAAFALDTGSLRHRESRGRYPILSDRDQIDGQAHVIVAWSRLALRRGRTPFEDRTYAFVSRLMDRGTDWPYVLSGGMPADLGLVRNVSLEHSREGRMWDTYDILTQSFVGAALEAMIPVARRRGDGAHASRWQSRLAALRVAVDRHLTRTLDGQKVYLEMRLPNSGAGTPFEGMGWLNLAPVAAQWEPLDRQVLRDTVAALRRRALFPWHDKTALALDWNADGTFSRAVIGKGVGWEIDYARQEGEWGRICQWLDLLGSINTTPLYMEAAGLGADDTWHLGDPGNGEQCSWWCWGMARLRRAVGLPLKPES